MKITPANRDRILNRFKRLASLVALFDLMVRQCGWCGKFMGFKRSRGGSKGVSHSICKRCFSRREAEGWR